MRNYLNYGKKLFYSSILHFGSLKRKYQTIYTLMHLFVTLTKSVSVNKWITNRLKLSKIGHISKRVICPSNEQTHGNILLSYLRLWVLNYVRLILSIFLLRKLWMKRNNYLRWIKLISIICSENWHFDSLLLLFHSFVFIAI